MAVDPRSDARNASGNTIHSQRDMRVIRVGAGASGLLFEYKLQRSFVSFTLNIYDKNEKLEAHGGKIATQDQSSIDMS